MQIYTTADLTSILRYVSSHKRVSRSKLIKKFNKIDIVVTLDDLLFRRYLSCDAQQFQNSNGIPSYDYTDNTTYWIGIAGRDYLEHLKLENRWFTSKFVVSQLIVPIIVSVITALITSAIANVLISTP